MSRGRSLSSDLGHVPPLCSHEGDRLHGGSGNRSVSPVRGVSRRTAGSLQQYYMMRTWWIIQNQNRAIGVLGQGRAGGEGWLFDAVFDNVVFQIVWEHQVSSLGTPTVTIKLGLFLSAWVPGQEFQRRKSKPSRYRS